MTLSRPIENASAAFGTTMQANIATTPDHLAGLLEAVASQRDRSAFAELFDYFAPRLKGFIRRRGVEAARAEDLASFIRQPRKIGGIFDGTRSSVAALAS
jgi:RNA polymerase sigma-70 factor (ECF subfamily)